MVTVPVWLAVVLLCADSMALAWVAGGEISRYRTRSRRHQVARHAAVVIAAARVHSR